MKAIVSVNEDWGIGCDNQLLCSIPGDMRMFKDLTNGGVVVCGRKTLLTFYKQKPLINRTNIVLTSSPNNIPDSFKENCDVYAEAVRKSDGKGILMKIDMKKETRNQFTKLITISDINLLDDVANTLGSFDRNNAFIIGGESIYKQLLPKCETVYVTKHNFTGKKPDTYFPNLDESDKWSLVYESNEMTSPDGIKYRFMTYRKSYLRYPYERTDI